MPGTRTPTVRLRHLAAEMRQLREVAGLTQEQVTDRIGVSRATLFRLENARGKPHRQLLLALLDLYKVSDSKRSAMLALHKAADQRGWWTRYESALQGEYPAYIGFEASALAVANYEGQAVPGLLQTADYAHALLATRLPKLSDSELRQRVEARMTRQLVLRNENPLELSVVIDEAALHRPVGGLDAMRAQLERLITDASLPNVDVRVLPYDVGAHVGLPGGFALLDFPPPDSPLVYVEHAGGDAFLDDIEDAAEFRATFEQLRTVALDGGQSVVMLCSLMKGKNHDQHPR